VARGPAPHDTAHRAPRRRQHRTEFCMSAPWSGYEPIVTHTFTITNEATRSDFLNICYANDVDDDIVDGFDALREGVMFKSADEVKAALKNVGSLDD
jgi:hypothetical protein